MKNNINCKKEIDYTKPVKFFATTLNDDGSEYLHEDTVVKFKNYEDMENNAGLYAFLFQFNRSFSMRYWWVYEDEEIKEGTTRIELRFNFQGDEE